MRSGCTPWRSSIGTCRGCRRGCMCWVPRRTAELAASLDGERYGELVAFLSVFYGVVLLDLGTGVAGPLVRLVIDRADQLVLVSTPEWVTATVVLEALSRLR